MAWYTTKEGKHINTDWFDKDRQIEENKKEAKALNRKIELKWESQVAPYATDRNRNEIEQQLESNIKKAEDAGYEIIPRPYQTRGSSGRMFDFTERKIENPNKPSDSGSLKLSAKSKLGEHYNNVKEQYEDVIILPASPILPRTTKGRQGFKQTYKAEYVIMAKNKRK